MPYVVVENTPGFPEPVEFEEFEEYGDAVSYANELADDLEEDGYTTDRSWASAGNLYAIYASRPDSMYDLGRVIEVLYAE